MKRICILMLLFVLNNSIASAQVQNLAAVNRVYLWDKPVTDDLTYKGVLPGNMHPVVVFTAAGVPVLALFNDDQFTQAQGYFTPAFMEANKSRIVGYEYVVTYIGRFSWMTRKTLRNLEGMQKVTAKGFNEKEKYTLMAQAPRTVVGTRDPNTGNILLAKEPPSVQQVSPEKPVVDTLKKVESNKFTPPLPEDKKVTPPKKVILDTYSNPKA